MKEEIKIENEGIMWRVIQFKGRDAYTNWIDFEKWLNSHFAEMFKTQTIRLEEILCQCEVAFIAKGEDFRIILEELKRVGAPIKYGNLYSPNPMIQL